ncbi:MAG: A/G-specific adenine glycosylase [Geminicoccaceae bacterium]
MAPVLTPTLPDDPARLRAGLLGWYDRARRRLPWRAEPGETADPWRVLVSEIMLQQTTVATVRGRYAGFLERFPDVASLAAAPLDDVLHAWQGLGYYRRARALHALAQAVMARHRGRLPAEPDALAALPGLGAYTAAAIRAIAFAEPVLAVDGNVARVLARLALVERPLPAAMPQLRRLADALAGGDRPSDLAQALIELGALVCRPRAPACLECPWSTACRARQAGVQDRLPAKPARKERPTRHGTAFLLTDKGGRILLERRPDEGLLGGLVALPGTPWVEGGPWPRQAALGHAPADLAWTPVPGTVRHVFTHFALELELLAGGPGSAEGLWARPADLGALALPTLTRKLLRHGGVAGA